MWFPRAKSSYRDFLVSFLRQCLPKLVAKHFCLLLSCTRTDPDLVWPFARSESGLCASVGRAQVLRFLLLDRGQECRLVRNVDFRGHS